MITVSTNLNEQTISLLRSINAELETETNNIMTQLNKEMKSSRQEVASAKKRLFSAQNELAAFQAKVIKLEQESDDSWMSDIPDTPIKAAQAEPATPASETKSQEGPVGTPNEVATEHTP